MKKDAEWLSRAMIVAAGSLYAHAALAGGLPGQQDGFFPAAAPQATAPTPNVQPAIYTAETTPVPLASADAPAPTPAHAREIECIAKVIRHEAANQPIAGQRAVAQVIRTRMNDGRFPTTACGVVRQAGQFFDVDAYQPSRTDARWATAVDVATETLAGEDEELAEGALFFHAHGSPMPNRTRVVQIADHVFYR